MLRPLLLLFALTAVPGAVTQSVTVNTEVSISSCPITYFGQKYEEVFVNFTTEHVVVCFDGFYNPQAGGDCLLAPPAVIVHYGTFSGTGLESLFSNVVPTIKSNPKCLLRFTLPSDLTESSTTQLIYLINYGSQTALGLLSYSQISAITATAAAVVDVLLNGTKVDELSVTDVPPDSSKSNYTDVSGCRHEGVVFQPGKVVSSAATCTTLTCNETAVLEITTCGPTETCDGNGV